MQFRARFFNAVSPSAIYNLGGGFNCMDDVPYELRYLLRKKARPELILLGIDPWWIQETRGPDWWEKGLSTCNQNRRMVISILGERAAVPVNDFATRNYRRIIAFLDKLNTLQSAWRDPVFHAGLQDRKRIDPETGRKLIGLDTSLKEGAIRNDGSIRCRSQTLDTALLKKQLDEEFLDEQEAFKAGKLAGSAFDEVAMGQLALFLERARKEDISVIVITTPISPRLNRLFRNNVESQIFWRETPQRLRELCRRYGAFFADFSKPDSYGGTEQGFIDLYHAGEVAYARILLKLRQMPETGDLLAPFIDPAQLQPEIENAHSPLEVYGD
jgi:hypothetical protein